MKNLSFILIFGLVLSFASCNKNEQEPQATLKFKHEGSTYSANYTKSENGDFVWSDKTVGELYESLIGENKPIHVVDDVVCFLNKDEASKLWKEILEERKNGTPCKEITPNTKANEISGFRVTGYFQPNFTDMITLNATQTNIHQVEKDAVSYYLRDNWAGTVRSFTFVVLRTAEMTFYPKIYCKIGF